MRYVYGTDGQEAVRAEIARTGAPPTVSRDDDREDRAWRVSTADLTVRIVDNTDREIGDVVDAFSVNNARRQTITARVRAATRNIRWEQRKGGWPDWRDVIAPDGTWAGLADSRRDWGVMVDPTGTVTTRGTSPALDLIVTAIVTALRVAP